MKKVVINRQLTLENTSVSTQTVYKGTIVFDFPLNKVFNGKVIINSCIVSAGENPTGINCTPTRLLLKNALNSNISSLAVSSQDDPDFTVTELKENYLTPVTIFNEDTFSSVFENVRIDNSGFELLFWVTTSINVGAKMLIDMTLDGELTDD
jgi:hypothetical protein